MTVGLVPASGSSQTCASPGLVEACIDDPRRSDVGEVSLVNGELTAEANGAIAAGAGNVTFFVDYVVEHTGLASDESLEIYASLTVYDSDGQMVGVDTVLQTLVNDGRTEGEIEVEVDTVAPMAEGGSIAVEAIGWLVSPSERIALGHAQSVSAITFLLAPPADVAEQVTVARMFEVGNFEASAPTTSVGVIDGEFLVAQDTSIRLEANGNVSSMQLGQVDNLFEQVTALLSVSWNGHFVSASASPIGHNCMAPCSSSAQTVPVELSVVVPGDLENPRSDLRVNVQADGHASYQVANDWFFESSFDYASGVSELVAVGP